MLTCISYTELIVFMLILTVLVIVIVVFGEECYLLARLLRSRLLRCCSALIEGIKVNRLLSSSGYKSCLDVGSVAGVLELPREASIFDIDGAEVTQGNRLEFKDGVNSVWYKVSLPNGASVRRTKRGRISIKRHGAVYTIKRSGYKCASMFIFVVYSLDSSLKWYFDGTEIEFPKSGNLEVVTAPVGYMIRLFGYDSENRLCDGIIVRVV